MKQHPLDEIEALPSPVQIAPGDWRSIETAPKDRNIIITGRYANGRAYVEESYWHYKGHWNARSLNPPTHWQPMPEPFGGWDRTAD